jgi:hypothetical protein
MDVIILLMFLALFLGLSDCNRIFKRESVLETGDIRMVLDRRFVRFDAKERIDGKPWVAAKHEKVGEYTQ